MTLDKEQIAFKIPLLVPHRICTEVLQKRNVQTAQKRQRRNTVNIV